MDRNKAIGGVFMKKGVQSIFPVLLAGLLAVPLIAPAFAQDKGAAPVKYKITNPYAKVEFGKWNAYKAQLHTHTTASDGEDTMREAVEAYYDAGYDCLAITDHGVVDRGWVKPNYRPVINFLGGTEWMRGVYHAGKLEGLSEVRLQEIADGKGRGGRGMIRVPFGIEQNPDGIPNMHVNSWFADWGNAFPGGAFDYAAAVRNIDRKGGLCVINHPILPMYDRALPVFAGENGRQRYIWKVQRLLEKYPALIGIDIAQDCSWLWDVLLQNVAPSSRNVFAVRTTDAHDRTDIATGGWVWALMPENTADHLKRCLANGAFFAADTYAANPDTIAAMRELGMEIHENAWGGEFMAAPGAAGPMITDITAGNDVITITAKGSKGVLWVSDGEIIAKGGKLSLASVSKDLGAYVRAVICGDGGVLYTQPFLLSYEGMPAGNPIPNYFVDFGSALGHLRLLLYPFSWLLDQLWLAIR